MSIHGAYRWCFVAALALTAACVWPACAEVPGNSAAGAQEIRIELQVSPALSGAPGVPAKPLAKANLVRTREVLRNRVVGYGLPTPRVQFQRPDRILIDLALGQSGAPSMADLKALLTETGLLQFRAIPHAYADSEEGGPEVNRGPEGETFTFRDASGKVVPADQVLRESKILASSRELVPSSRVISIPRQQPQVYFELGEPARTRFRDFTRTHVGSYIAIVLDGRILACPIIKSAVPGEGVIEGGFDQPGGAERARRLAALLNSGPLPLAVRWVTSRPLSAAAPPAVKQRERQGEAPASPKLTASPDQPHP